MHSTPLRTPIRRYRLPTGKIERGMFVAEVDRPWLDTPFILEGLLVESEAEIETLRRHCRYAYVDLARSRPEVLASIRRSALDRPIGRDRPSTQGARGQGRALLGRLAGTPETASVLSAARLSLLGRVLGWLRKAPASASGDDAQAVARALTATATRLELPPLLKLQRYSSDSQLEAELPRARRAWSQGAETLRSLMSELRADARVELKNIEQVAEGLVESMIENPDAMMWVARLRSEHQGMYQHCLKVALYLIALGRHVGFPREDLVRLGLIGMLADVGKMHVPRELLEKPGMLTPAEHDIVKQHVRLGVEALRKSLRLDEKVEQGILQHHERLDGSGYPQGLSGRAISVYGRMAAIADCFAALITERPYAEAQSPQDALMSLYSWAGASFHEPLVEQFVQAIGVFPVGGLVELSNGEVAIVLAHNRVRRLEPHVLVLAGPDKTPLPAPFERNLLKRSREGEGPAVRIARGLAAGAYGLKPGDYYADESASRDALAVPVG